MNNRRTPEQTAVPAALRGRWLVFARAAWLAVAFLTLGLDALTVPYYYLRDRAACAGAECVSSTGLTPDQFRALHEMGLSTGFYAAFDTVVQFMVVPVFAAVAAVIFWKRSDDPMALFGSFTLLVFGGAAFTSELLKVLVAAHAIFRFPTELLDYIGQVCFVTFLYIFPDGRFVPPWTRWFVVAGALLWLPSIFFQVSLPSIIFGPVFFGLLGTMVVAQVYRYRKVSNQRQRQQTKWVVFGVVVALIGFSGAAVFGILAPAVRQLGPLVQMGAGTLVNGFILLIPLSIGVAMLRSRLYDIDLVINRTLVYGSLTAMLIALYFGAVVALQRVFVLLTGEESTLAIVASTLLIAALFNPLRRRIQSFIDRRFYRRKYDAERVLAGFSARLRDETDLDTLKGDLIEVVGETVWPAHASLWLRDAVGERPEAAE